VREYIRPTDIANEISMKRSLFSGSFLVVEGVTDSRLYGKFIDKNECDVVVAHSKDNVRTSVREIFRRRGDRNIIGIIDSDTDRLKGVVYNHPIFVTDCRDIETLMIRGHALESVLSEYGDPGRIDPFVERYGEIRDVLIGSCYPLGILMHISDTNGHGLSFKDPDHASFLDKRNLKPDIDAMLDSVISQSPHSRVTKEELMIRLEKELIEKRDPWNVCRGHDMVAVLTIGLREIFGGYNSQFIRSGGVAGALRLAYDRETFSATRLFIDTSEWCASEGMKVWSF